MQWTAGAPHCLHSLVSNQTPTSTLVSNSALRLHLKNTHLGNLVFVTRNR
jgi:hypothetical protein